MGITDAQKASAQDQQNNIAQDLHPKIRLVAGPGTGKSRTIVKRILWLLSQGYSPNEIAVVSFTRASARDLLDTFLGSYQDNEAAPNVRISTLHSLALSILKRADLLNYPESPSILDKWETKHILENEFQCIYENFWEPHQKFNLPRCEEIRLDFESYCNTNNYHPNNIIPPEIPITDNERNCFIRFHDAWTQLYSCILPGEVVRECLNNMKTGLLDLGRLLGITHLIVDEYQDLNPVDIEFIDYFANNGINVFVCGDDDQSVYSFRYASPEGIIEFVNRHSLAIGRELTNCFRCTPSILASASSLLNRFPGPNRIPKHTISLYANSSPVNSGYISYWHFRTDDAEASNIADVCQQLINNGVSANEILILLSNSKLQLPILIQALSDRELLFDTPREINFLDQNIGRFWLGLLRVVINSQDYIGHRLLFGSIKGVGIKTICKVANITYSSGVNYRDLFHNQNNDERFDKRSLTLISRIRTICDRISSWQGSDRLDTRINEIQIMLIGEGFDSDEIGMWQVMLAQLPQGITLEELLAFIKADQPIQRNRVLHEVSLRSGTPQESLPQKIQIMTMHGAKGLSSKIVFIPGLEKSIIPNSKSERVVGLVEESARLLYVSITRTRAACFLSYADQRIIHGTTSRQTPSRFNTSLNGVFQNRFSSLSEIELLEILDTIRNL